MNSVEKMREALCVVRDALTTIAAHLDDQEFVRTWIELSKKTIAEALAMPMRQCDVGTAAEQSQRYNSFCYNHRSYEKCCEGCPADGKADCEFAWAQLPYEDNDNNRKG